MFQIRSTGSRVAVSLVAIVGLSACGGGRASLIQGISLAAGQTPQLGQRTDLVLSGQGICAKYHIDWGDDSETNGTDYDFTAHTRLDHEYDGWPGGKTVTVEAVSGCAGKATIRFTIEPAIVKVGWARDPNRNVATCNPVPNKPPLAMHSRVHVTSPATPVVNFGCPLNNCIGDADGRPGTVAANAFPFPGMREFSLVLRVGTQLFQGGKSETFTTATSGVLELCQNTDQPAHATGGWEVDLRVDQLGK